MIRQLQWNVGVAIGLAGCGVCGAVASSAASEGGDFAHGALPILRRHCVECHADGTYKGGLSIDTRESLLGSDVVVVGQSDESELILRVTDPDPDWRMPPDRDPLSAEEIETLRAWIDQGANWQEGFTFRRDVYVAPMALREVELPPAKDGRDHPVDRIVDQYLADHGIAPPPPVGDAAFYRRVSLDLLGVLPDPDDVDRFASDPSPGKRDALIAELLDDREAFTAHWLTFWNDLLRNDYAGTGYIDGGRKQITGWLYDALFQNKPYDQFVRELIDPTDASEGFIRGIQWRGRVNASQVPPLQFAQNVSQVFLGINLKCASCHDSFIDDWSLRDAYGMAAVAADEPLEMYRCDKATGQTAQPGFLFPELGAIDAEAPREERLKQLADLMVHADNGRTARTIVNRLWQRLMGRGIVHPVDAMDTRPWSEDLLDYLAQDLATHHYNLNWVLARIATSQAYQAQCVDPDTYAMEDDRFRGPSPRRFTAEQFLDAVWRLTGAGPEEPHPAAAEAAAAHAPAGTAEIRAALVASDPLMRSLGRPNREQVVSTRPAELTTLQALDLSNGQILADLLARGAARLARDHADLDTSALIDQVFRMALSRSPSETERKICRDMLEPGRSEQGLADMLWAVVMLPEFQTVR